MCNEMDAKLWSMWEIWTSLLSCSLCWCCFSPTRTYFILRMTEIMFLASSIPSVAVWRMTIWIRTQVGCDTSFTSFLAHKWMFQLPGCFGQLCILMTKIVCLWNYRRTRWICCFFCCDYGWGSTTTVTVDGDWSRRTQSLWCFGCLRCPHSWWCKEKGKMDVFDVVGDIYLLGVCSVVLLCMFWLML